MVCLGLWLKEEKISIYGPPAPEDNPGPAKWTAPYFDCGGSNKWVVSAVSPIVDLYPRYNEYLILRDLYPRYNEYLILISDYKFIHGSSESAVIGQRSFAHGQSQSQFIRISHS